ncbi:MAG: ABC transporter permease [Bradymonadales bacterium]|nr:ABC transporter permease [Bradymonadales bacterium]
MTSDRFSYILHRLLGALFVIFSVSTLVFLVVRWVPGDPVDSILGENAAELNKQVLAECLHLNDSLLRQYLYFLGDIANGTLGTFCDNPDVTVRDRIVEVLPYTVELALASMLLALLIAIPLGVLAALRQGSWLDLTALTVALLGVSIPNFWLGPMLLLAFSITLRMFPDPGAGVTGLHALVLPAITLGTALAAKLARMTRSSMLEVLSADYIRTARAKGLPERQVIWKHALRNALVPVVTVVGLQVGALLSGAIIVEKVFGRPGLGTLLLDAISQRNYMLVQGCVLVIAFTYVLVNLLTDLAYMAVDPRISLERKRG